jgi:hypothetical protein
MRQKAMASANRKAKRNEMAAKVMVMARKSKMKK